MGPEGFETESGNERARLVRDLVEYRGNPARLLQELQRFGWDSERVLVDVTPGDVRRVIGGYLHEELSQTEVEAWAEAIEVRDDVGFASDAVRDAVYVLANPALEGQLTDEVVARLRASLVQPYPCPCCGFRTLSESSPSDEICTVCFWQDDFVDNHDSEVRGPNRVSLSEARASFARLGASESRFAGNVREALPEEGPPEPWTETRSPDEV